ncbi:hypothetical protein [Occallatibacter riparius]|uniref:Uncharacterized protein n=1 Tax=Occallatibacter riparius TaxID=1002689 RepID=A0A9J7BP02_9BACT|nr:hypothetical protein [Occallatibacter riparius]UWZ83474.1 hypothetical protein MOP44_23275 [Occallatibacter riparius]
MSIQESFTRYWVRVLRRFLVDATPWARDNIAFAGLALLLPLAIVYLRDRHHQVDWELIKAALLFYAISLAAYGGVHLLRTPWKMDREQTQAVNRLTEEAGSLRRQAADRQPKLAVELRELLFLESEYPKEVFVRVSLENERPDSICTVDEYELSFTIGDHTYRSREIVHDLNDFVAIAIGGGEAARKTPVSEDLSDLVAGITHSDPVRYGAPRYGWIHFSFPDLSKMVRSFCSADHAEICVFDPFGGCAKSGLDLRAEKPIRRIESTRWDGTVRWV